MELNHIRFAAGFVFLILISCNNPGDIDSTSISSLEGVSPGTNIPTGTSSQTSILSTMPPSPMITVETKGTTPTFPLPTDDSFWEGMRNQGYEVVFSTSHVGPMDYVYSVFAFKDTSLEPEFGDETNSEICRLAFYRWDGKKNVLLTDFGATTYPESSSYSGFPVNCSLANWDNDFWFTDIWGPGWALDEIRETLKLDGYWSDVNENGFPEVGIFFWYCPNACHGYEGAVHFYEIQNTNTVVHITDNLKGILLPWKILHSKNPTTLYVYDPSLEYEPHNYIDTWWIYSWDGLHYIDVTSEYAEEFLYWLERSVVRIEKEYGSPINYTRTDFLEILFRSDKYGVRDEAFEIFLKITDPVNWPDTDQVYSCWLQMIREQAQRDYDENKLYSMPPTPFGLSMSENFDIQSCQYIES